MNLQACIARYRVGERHLLTAMSAEQYQLQPSRGDRGSSGCSGDILEACVRAACPDSAGNILNLPSDHSGLLRTFVLRIPDGLMRSSRCKLMRFAPIFCGALMRETQRVRADKPSTSSKGRSGATTLDAIMSQKIFEPPLQQRPESGRRCSGYVLCEHNKPHPYD